MELTDHAYSPPAVYSELKLRLASVIGSDSHHPSSIGARFTWVKMESPSLEALRLALHDGEDGVKRSDTSVEDPNQIGTRFYLRRLTVSRGQKIGNGQDMVLEMSPWLTTLIGGRGSGKSSILDFLRIVLAKTDGLPPQLRNEFDDFTRVPRARGELGMLRAESSVRLEVVKDGRDIALTWQADGTWTQEELDGAGNWTPSNDVGDVAKRFPLRIFSQKQLYEMTKQPDVLLNLIDERWDKRTWLDVRRANEEAWLKNRREIRQLEREIAGGSQIRAELDDVRAKIRIFDDSGHKDVLNDFQASQVNKQALDQKANALDSAGAEFTGFLDKLPILNLAPELKTALGVESTDALQTVLTEYEELRTKLATVLAELGSIRTKWSETVSTMPWKAIFDEATRKYEELQIQLQQAGGADISGYAALVEQRTALEAKVEKLTQYESEVATSKNVGEELLREIDTHEKRMRTERRTVIANWRQPTAGERLRVTLHDMGNLEAAHEQFRQLIRKPGEIFAGDIYRSTDGGGSTGLLARLIEQTDVHERWQVLQTIRSILSDCTNTDPKGLDRRFVRHLEQLRQDTPEDLDRIAIWTPEDRLKLELIKADGSVEDIETGSAGQRTAGLLGLILSLDDSPLIIDQPEDDLETRLISSLVVNGVRELKKLQQVIVVTHNPNIPVNGAAEQIVEMRFSGGQIKTGAMGALQRHEIRHAVCEIMEGGKEALDKRFYRISQALS